MPHSPPEFDFSEIVQNAKDVVIVTKADPIDEPGPEIIYVNQAFSEMTGYSAEEVIGKSPRILQSKDTEIKEKLAIRRALEKKEAVRVTLRNYTKLGKEYWIDLSILPLRDNNGKRHALRLHPKRHHRTKEFGKKATGSMSDRSADNRCQPQSLQRDPISGILPIQKKPKGIRPHHDRHRSLQVGER